MATPDWATVLATLYEGPSEEVGYDIDKEHLFVSETNLNVEEAESAVEKLKDWQLIKLHSNQTNDPNEDSEDKVTFEVKLAEKGFNVAHDRELANRNNRINAALVVLTLFLVIVNAVNSVALNATIRFLILVTILGLLLILVFKTELLRFDALEQ